MDKNYIVTKSNKLITCNYDLTLQEQKIILTLASMVQPQDTEFQDYEFKIKDFIELLDIQGQNKYTELPKITKELKKKVFDIQEGTDTIQVSWLGGVRIKHKEGILILSLDKSMKPYMLELKELYTSYKLGNILSLKSKYSIRIYEILKSNSFKKCIEIKIEELKSMIGATEKSYSVYQNVKNRILIPGQKELASKTDISFKFDEIRTGRKTTSIKFYIKANKTKNKANEEACSTLESKSTNEEEKSSTELINVVKSVFKENITEKEAKFILNTAKGDINIIKEKYAISQNVSKIDSIVGWTIKAIEEDYQSPKGKEKGGSFNDYEQRAYDFDNVEKKASAWLNGEENTVTDENYDDSLSEMRKVMSSEQF